MRLGLLGGSFDPPHFGHLHVARCARDELALDRVRLIPAARPPHKLGRTLAEDGHRLAMLALLKGELSWLEIDAREFKRLGPSFTHDTLVELRRELAQGDSLYFLIGSDSLVDLPGWHRAADLVELATFVTVPRDPPSLALGRAQVRARLAAAADRILAHVLDAEMLPISSSQIRARVAAGLPIVELVPKAIADYIERHRLYRDAEHDRAT
jgi:nicotinate-nucleotide adenylyltransferase